MIMPEFEHEMANTRRMLERVAGEKFGLASFPNV